MKKPMARIISSLGERIWRAARVDRVMQEAHGEKYLSLYAARGNCVMQEAHGEKYLSLVVVVRSNLHQCV